LILNLVIVHIKVQ